MKKGILRHISIVLCSILFVMICGFTAEAAESYTYGDWTYSFGDKGLKIVSYNGNSKEVTIPSEIDGYKVGVIGRQAFKNNYTMRMVTIPETITSIESEAFYGCAGLSQINFNAKNCEVPSIWRYDSNRGVGVFSGAGSAAASLNVTFGDKVTDIPVDLFNTDIENGYDYAHVTSVTFSNNTKTIGNNAFQNCRDLEILTLGKNVTTINAAAFYDCSSMEKVTFKDELQYIGISAFENCTSLEEIVWGTGLDTIDNYAFKGCSNLKEAIIPKPTTVIGRQAFANDIQLEKVTIPSSVTSIKSEAFYNTIKVSRIDFNAKNCVVPTIWRYDENRGVGVFCGTGSAVNGLKVVFGSTVPRVPDNLFNTDKENGYDICYVTDIEFNKSVKEIGQGAFEGCESLEEVKLGTGITTLCDYAFLRCTNLKKITLDNKLSAIGHYAFQECTNLEKIVWGSGLDTIGDYAFKDCTSLLEAKIPYPTTVIGKKAFYNNTSLKSVTIPTSVTWIGSEAFYNTTKLAQINFNAKNCAVPDIWRYDGNRGVGVFAGAGSGTSSLKVVFGSKVTIVPRNLFNTDVENGYDHAYITSVSIPSNVKEIGASAFEDCERLASVTYKKVNATLGENIYLRCPASMKINCYYGSTTEDYAKLNNIKYEYLKPTKPTVKSIANTSEGLKIEWGGVSGASRYYIYKKTSASGAWKKLDYVSSGKRTFVDDEVSTGKTYYYTVKAFAPGNLFSDYNKTGLKEERLKAPTNLSASNSSAGIIIKWKKSAGAAKYQIYRSKGTGSYKKIATVSSLSYTDKDIVNGNKYRYKVYAYDNGSKSAASSVITTYRLKKASVTDVKSNSAGKLTVKWSKNTAATGYKVQYAANKSFKNAKTVTVKGKNNVSKTISGLGKGKRYYVRVSAYKTVSNKTYTSAKSDSKNVVIKK